MLNLNIVLHRNEVPTTWVFETYCNLSVSLSGQTVIITSLWNISEKTPSMHIYVKSGQYVFKDFSSGKSGDSLNLVAHLYNESFSKATIRIINDYNLFLKTNKAPEKKIITEEQKYQLSNHKIRTWNVNDAKFWKSFNISSKVLNHFNVKPLSEFTLSKLNEKDLIYKNNYCYGYFKKGFGKEGDLYRAYLPYSKESKFFIFDSEYVQGQDQLTFNNDYCIITSSLKDTMAFYTTKIKADSVAPTGENTLLKESVIKWLKTRYPYLVVLFDNDDPGKKAAKKYEKFNIPSVNIDLEKDISDSSKTHGIKILRDEILTQLRKL